MKSNFERSCLRWPGNKYSLLNTIIELKPEDFINYHEPFLGSASVFLNINNQNNSFLSDQNELLINFYTQVQINLEELLNLIHTKKNTKDFFYRERDIIYTKPVELAAQFYFLNRTCFNGIYRVNSSGKFNVPYGYRENFEILDRVKLERLSYKLSNVILSHRDFNETLENINAGDFVFLDPPYSSKTKTLNFNMYNEKLFLWADQIRLQEYCETIINKGAFLMLTNLYNHDVHELFATSLNLNSHITERYSGIGSKSESRGTYKEYIFTNY